MILRNPHPRMVVYESTALGRTDISQSAGVLDTTSGIRSVSERSLSVPRNVTLMPGAKRQALADALACGSAVSGLPDAILNDPEVKRLGLVAEKEPIQ